MADLKREAVDMLTELIELTILDEGDPQSFRVRAYESALHGVEGYAGDLGKLGSKGLQAIAGIGKSTAEKLLELFEKGRVEKLEGLRAKYPEPVVALMRLPGVGPKAVKRLRSELGIESVDDLRTALVEKKLRDLRGFGAKSEEKLARMLERLAREGGEKRTPVSVALPLAERVVAELASIPGVVRASHCGSLRRFVETVGDLDIVVASTDPAPVMEAVATMSMVAEIIGRGETKTSVRTRRGMQIDVRVVEPAAFGAALLYFTGSKSHNIKLRQRALDRGWTLNEYALSEIEGGRVIARETEEEIYRALDLAFIDPVLREDMGELELAASGSLPEVLDVSQVRGDFHVHTSVSSDSRAPLEEVVAEARARGYGVLAITDHAEGTVAGATREAFLAQREQIRALAASFASELTILHGVELNIGPEGELDYDLEFRRGFDFCLASVHDHFDLEEAAQTKRIVRAMEDPTVTMIGHLSARMIGARPGIALDLDAVFSAAERTDTALEINGGLPRLDVSVDVLRRARDRKVTFVITSDAHQVSELDRVRYGCLSATKAWIPRERIANTWNREKLGAWATKKLSASH